MNKMTVLGLGMLLAISACDNDGNKSTMQNSATADSNTRVVVYAITENDELIGFFADAPGQLLSRAPVTGLLVDNAESPPFAVSLDFRPASGELYLLTSDNRLYVVGLNNGNARFIGRPLAELGQGIVDIRAMDFSPEEDAIRILNADTAESYRISPSNASLLAQDGGLHFAPGDPNSGQPVFPIGLGYSGVPGSAQSTAYVLDEFNDVVARLGTINDAGASARGGQLTTIGNWDFSSAPVSMAVMSQTPTGYSITSSANSDEHSDLSEIDLATGLSTSRGRIGSEAGRFVIAALAVVPGSGEGSGTAGEPDAPAGDGDSGTQPAPDDPADAEPDNPDGGDDPNADDDPGEGEDPGGDGGELTQQCVDQGLALGFPEGEVRLFCETVFGPVDG